MRRAGHERRDQRRPGTVSQLLGGLQEGDGEAVPRLWLRYFQPMVRLAARSCGPRDAEDVALEAFWSLCQLVASPSSEDRFPRLENRAHLWKLLACFAARRALDVVRKEARRGLVLTDDSVLAAFADREPPPELTAAVADLLECLPTDELRRIAVARLEGRGNEEIARLLGRGLSTVERKLQVIRALWRDAP